jgi:hypothetical protein
VAAFISQGLCFGTASELISKLSLFVRLLGCACLLAGEFTNHDGWWIQYDQVNHFQVGDYFDHDHDAAFKLYLQVISVKHLGAPGLL